jgi:hypothetical protein
MPRPADLHGIFRPRARCSRPLVRDDRRGRRAMDVVLHVGAHRTASTTFQKTLGANGAALAEAGRRLLGSEMHALRPVRRADRRAGTAGRRRRLAGLRRVARGRGGRNARARGSCSSARKTCLAPCGRRSRAAGSTPMRDPVSPPWPRPSARIRLTIAMAMRAQDAWWRSVGAFRAARDGIMGPCARRTPGGAAARLARRDR